MLPICWDISGLLLYSAFYPSKCRTYNLPYRTPTDSEVLWVSPWNAAQPSLEPRKNEMHLTQIIRGGNKVRLQGLCLVGWWWPKWKIISKTPNSDTMPLVSPSACPVQAKIKRDIFSDMVLRLPDTQDISSSQHRGIVSLDTVRCDVSSWKLQADPGSATVSSLILSKYPEPAFPNQESQERPCWRSTPQVMTLKCQLQERELLTPQPSLGRSRVEPLSLESRLLKALYMFNSCVQSTSFDTAILTLVFGPFFEIRNWVCITDNICSRISLS